MDLQAQKIRAQPSCCSDTEPEHPPAALPELGSFSEAPSQAEEVLQQSQAPQNPTLQRTGAETPQTEQSPPRQTLICHIHSILPQARAPQSQGNPPKKHRGPTSAAQGHGHELPHPAHPHSRHRWGTMPKPQPETLRIPSFQRVLGIRATSSTAQKPRCPSLLY